MGWNYWMGFPSRAQMYKAHLEGFMLHTFQNNYAVGWRRLPFSIKCLISNKLKK